MKPTPICFRIRLQRRIRQRRRRRRHRFLPSDAGWCLNASWEERGESSLLHSDRREKSAVGKGRQNLGYYCYIVLYYLEVGWLGWVLFSAGHEPFHYFCRSVHSSSSNFSFRSVPVPVPPKSVPVPVHSSVQIFFRKYFLKWDILFFSLKIYLICTTVFCS